MKDTCIDQNLPQELFCEICAKVCKEALKNIKTGLIFCCECSSQQQIQLSGLIYSALRSIQYKCKECSKFKSYFKYRGHLDKCLKYHQNQQKGMERFEIQGQTHEIKLATQILVEELLNQKFDQQIIEDRGADTYYKIFCKNKDCYKQIHIQEVKQHFNNCEFQEKSCKNCGHWTGRTGDYLIHKQMCYLELDRTTHQIKQLELEIDQQEMQKLILQLKQTKIQNKLSFLIQRQQVNQ